MITLVCTSIARSFSTNLISIWVAPSMYWCRGLFVPRCRTSHFSLLNCMRLLLAHFPSKWRTLWKAARPPGGSATLLTFLSPANTLRMHSAPLTKMLNRLDLARSPVVHHQLLVTHYDEFTVLTPPLLSTDFYALQSMEFSRQHWSLPCEHEYCQACWSVLA